MSGIVDTTFFVAGQETAHQKHWMSRLFPAGKMSRDRRLKKIHEFIQTEKGMNFFSSFFFVWFGLVVDLVAPRSTTLGRGKQRANSDTETLQPAKY